MIKVIDERKASEAKDALYIMRGDFNHLLKSRKRGLQRKESAQALVDEC